MNATVPVGRRVVRVGHRGAAGHGPENTLAAIAAGIALGVDFVEVDVRRTRDGRMILLHDANVDRTTDGRGLVSEMTWDEVRRLDAGAGQRIPSLEEGLAAANGRVGVMLELKAAGIAAAVVAAVRAAKFMGEVVYAAFDPAAVAAVRDLDAGARTMVLIERSDATEWMDWIRRARGVGAGMVGLGHLLVTAEAVRSMQAASLAVWVFTVNRPAEMARVRAAGVDGVISDYPERCWM